jgi:hypothetical protein
MLRSILILQMKRAWSARSSSKSYFVFQTFVLVSWEVTCDLFRVLRLGLSWLPVVSHDLRKRLPKDQTTYMI